MTGDIRRHFLLRHAPFFELQDLQTCLFLEHQAFPHVTPTAPPPQAAKVQHNETGSVGIVVQRGEMSSPMKLLRIETPRQVSVCP